jgi:hypothetical protein
MTHRLFTGLFFIILFSSNAQEFRFGNTGTSSWTVPDGINMISIYCWGGGGAGGSVKNLGASNTLNATGGSGGSGGFNKIINYSVTPGKILSITVGSGGQRNSGPDGGNGGSGGLSSVKINNNTIVSAGGGLGGREITTSGITAVNGNGGAPNGVNGTSSAGGSSLYNPTSPYLMGNAGTPNGSGSFGNGVGGNNGSVQTTYGAVNGANGNSRGGGGGGGALKDNTMNPHVLIARGGNGGYGGVVIFGRKLLANPQSHDWNCIQIGGTCPVKYFPLQGYYLMSSIIVTPPAGYVVSNSSNFSTIGTNTSPLSISVGNYGFETTLYVKLQSTSIAGQYNGNLTISCPGTPGVITQIVPLNAVVGNIPNSTINYNGPTTVCSGNQVTLSIDSLSGLIYQWKNNNINIAGANNSIFNVANTGNYSVKVINSDGCSTTSNGIQITINSLPSSTISSNSPIEYCYGDIILNNLTVTQNQSYQWNTGEISQSITVSQAGTYSVLVTDGNGCQNSDSVQIIVNPLPNVNTGNDQTICQGHTVTLVANGANTYSWNNNITNNVAFTPTSTNTYIVTGTDANGCQNSDSVQITVNPLPNVNAGNDQTICQGNIVTLTANGANSYAWNNNITNNVAFTPTTTNTYIVTGTDANGCQDSDTVQVTVNPTSSSQLTQTAVDSFTLNDQTYTQSGTCTQVLQNSYGCDSTITLNLTISTSGINELNNQAFSIYPNPASNLIHIDYDGDFEKLEIIDSKGALVFDSKEHKKEYVLPANIQTGYYIGVIHDEKMQFRKELLIQR